MRTCAELVQFKKGAFVITGDYLQLVAFFVAALAMALFIYIANKKNIKWLDDFSIAGSMLVGMAATVTVGLF